jgi:hypothetical protein
LSDRIEALLSEGLGHFVKGDNAAAVVCWETVLAEEPQNTRAREFMAYVRATVPPSSSSLPPPPLVVQPAPPRTEPSLAAVPAPQGGFPPHEDLSNAPTSGRMAAVVAPRSKTGDWFRDAVQTTGGERPLGTQPATGLTPPPSVGFTPPPLTPGVQPLAQEGSAPLPNTTVQSPANDPLLQQVLAEMNAASQALPYSTQDMPVPSAPPPPSFTPPPPAPSPSEDRGSATMARGASLFGDGPVDAPVLPPPPGAGVVQAPAGPWEAVMSPAPVGAAPREDSGEIDVTVEEDANADGLGTMWSSLMPLADPEPAAAVTPTPAAPITSPWDEGALPTTGVVDLDRTAAPPVRGATSKFSATPRSNTPGMIGGASDVEGRCAGMMARVKELHDLGDFSGSLEIVEKVLELDPKNSQARDYMERNEETLLKMYESKLGNLEKTPRLQMGPDQIIWLNLHHKAGFVLSRVDGMATFEDVMSLSAMPRLDTVRILAQLLQTGVITAK